MLSTALPAVPRNGPDSIAEMSEAFNLSAIGAYPSLQVTSRVIESFHRSYGFANLKHTPRAVDGTPGWCMAFYPDQEVPTVVIAIAGIADLGAVTAWLGDPYTVAVAGTAGRVNRVFNTWATTILTAILADADFVAFRANRRINFRIAGFSAGAAIAEIIAAKIKVANPTWRPLCWKFGAPMIGTSSWVQWCEDNFTRINWYVYGDPIRAFPAVMMQRTGLGGVIDTPLDTLWNRMSPDPVADSIRPDGELGEGMPNVSQLDRVRLVAQLRNYSEFTTDMFDPPNVWWLHARSTFRWCLQKYLVINSQADSWRMLGLEYPGENQWNHLFGGAETVTPEMMTLVDPPPDDVDVPPLILQRMIRLADVAAGAGGGGEGWGDVDMGGGGDGWGGAPAEDQRGIRIRMRR